MNKIKTTICGLLLGLFVYMVPTFATAAEPNYDSTFNTVTLSMPGLEAPATVVLAAAATDEANACANCHTSPASEVPWVQVRQGSGGPGATGTLVAAARLADYVGGFAVPPGW